MTEKTRLRIEKAACYAAELCMKAGEDQAFYDAFWQRLIAHPDILAEFVYYMEHQDFACRVKVENRTVADILVWQIDHFKAAMDQGREEMRSNKEKMVLYAFDTMTRMADDPQDLGQRMDCETGTDYPGKF